MQQQKTERCSSHYVSNTNWVQHHFALLPHRTLCCTVITLRQGSSPTDFARRPAHAPTRPRRRGPAGLSSYYLYSTGTHYRKYKVGLLDSRV